MYLVGTRPHAHSNKSTPLRGHSPAGIASVFPVGVQTKRLENCGEVVPCLRNRYGVKLQ